MSSKQRVRVMDEETSARLTASYVVPDLIVAIQEAVYNAIDANARSVKIAVDVAHASFSVTDDGHGIHPDEMYEHTFESIATSKASPSTRKYSHRGQFLVSLGTLAKEVEIESRVKNFWTSSRKLMQNARVVFNAHSKTSRVTKGTYLRVDSLFWLLPVRQRELALHASARSRIAKRLSSFFHSLSMIWPTLSIDVSYADAKVPRIRVIGVTTCEERLRETFGEILGREMEYVSFDAEDSPFTVRGYIAVIHDGSGEHAESLESPGWKQARSYYQFVFLDNTWMEEFQRDCCKTINAAAMRLEIGIPIFVLKISAKSHEYELHSDGDTRVVNLKRPELLTKTLRGFVQILQTRIQETENYQATEPECIEETSCVETKLLEAPPVMQRAAHSDELEAEIWREDQYATTSHSDAEYAVDRYTDSTEEDPQQQVEYYIEDCSEDDQFLEDGSYEYGELALEGEYAPAYALEYEYHEGPEVHGYAEAMDEPGMYESYGDLYGNYTEVYVDERHTQDTVRHGCAHCASCHRSQPVQGFYAGNQRQLGFEVNYPNTAYATPKTEYAEDIYYTVHDAVPRSMYAAESHSYEDEPEPDYEFDHDEVDDDSRRSTSMPSKTAKPAPIKQEGCLNELFFGSNALHRVAKESIRPRAQSTVVRKLEPAFKEEEESYKPQSEWLSSRRLGREVAPDHDGSLPISPSTPATEKEEEVDAHDEECELNAGSDQLSEYFSFEKLLRTHKQPTQSVIASFASKRAALADSLAPLPGEAASSVRVSHLPHDLHSASAKTMALDKSIFRTLQVIKQVDRKFILVKVVLNRGDDGSGDADEAENVLLLCIDQHAADERVRLELLESQVFGVRGDEQNVETVEHEPSLPVSLNHRERETIEFFADEIRSWGFGVDLDEHTAWLTHTPKIDTRVATVDDFREYLQLLASRDPYVARRVLRPPVITRFLHSRACRSAIMFGDYLSISQCRDIVEQLSQCQLPFQCAHGRPSIVPLVELM